MKLSYLILPIIGFLIYNTFNKNEFLFCFVNADKREPISNLVLDIKIIQDNQSPLFLKTDSLGCFTFKTTNDQIHFVVQSPFYKTDTIIRHINSNKNHTVKLETDDYALMLDYFANGNIKDREKRKNQLDKMFTDDAIIYKLFPNNIGVELYTKEEFIRMLTIPTSSLKRLKIIDKVYKNDRIIKLKFMLE